MENKKLNLFKFSLGNSSQENALTEEGLNDLEEVATEQLNADYACYFGVENSKDILKLIKKEREKQVYNLKHLEDAIQVLTDDINDLTCGDEEVGYSYPQQREDAYKLAINVLKKLKEKL